MILFDVDPGENEPLNARLAEALKADIDFATDSDLTTAEHYAHRFPAWTRLQEPWRCQHIIEELYMMASDGYVHQLTPLYAYVLYESVTQWAVELMDRFEEVPASELQQLEEERALWEEVSGLIDSSFVAVEAMANRVIAGNSNEAPANVLPYLVLMPRQIRAQVARALRRSTANPAP